jgi:hypothetical protein
VAYSAIFAVVVGLGMIGQWSLSYLSNQIPELEDEPIRIGFHLAAEIVTALSLIVSGIALMAGVGWAGSAYLVSIGMLFYTAIVSPGYFAQKGEWKWLGIFAVLISGGLASLIPIV